MKNTRETKIKKQQCVLNTNEMFLSDSSNLCTLIIVSCFDDFAAELNLLQIRAPLQSAPLHEEKRFP